MLTPELFGALAMVLGARILAEGALSGTRQLVFGILPLVGGGLVVAGAGASGTYSWLGFVYYLGAGTGTVLGAVSDLRGRR